VTKASVICCKTEGKWVAQTELQPQQYILIVGANFGEEKGAYLYFVEELNGICIDFGARVQGTWCEFS
jgi:hypothetical protein